MKIKFKAKVKYNGYGFFHNDWIEGSLEIKYMGDYFIHYIDIDEFGNLIREIAIEVIPETVCQLVTTIEGIDYYENDNIECYNHDSDMYYSGYLRFSYFTMGYVLSDRDNEYDFYKYHIQKITGNIHDKK